MKTACCIYSLQMELAPLPLQASPVPTCSLCGGSRCHLGTVFPIFKPASIGAGGCVQSRSGCVYWEALDTVSIARSANTNTLPCS